MQQNYFLVHSSESKEKFLPEVIQLAKWGTFGLLAAIIAVSLTLPTMARPALKKMYLDRDQVDDLQRLLAKVEEIRARNILKYAPEEQRAQLVRERGHTSATAGEGEG